MNAAYEQLADVRAHDRFHPTQDAHALIETFHPPTVQELVLDLSAVTSAFYGVLLQTFADLHGPAGLDAASRAFFFRLGRLKARAAVEAGGSAREQHAYSRGHAHRFTSDARDVVTVVIAAIYNASPEYRFEVLRHEPELCEIHLRGTDRYLRAAQQLGIAQHLRWPTLHPFLEGAAAELGLTVRVSSYVLAVGSAGAMHTRYLITAL